MANFSRSPEAERMAESIIAEHHPHLEQARLMFLLTDGSKSKAVLANPLQRYLTSGADEDAELGADWVLLIEHDDWEGRTEPGREALLDELLAQCGQEEDEKSGQKRWVRRKGVTVWPEVLRRRGFWRDEYKAVETAALQPELPGMAVPVLAK